VNRLAVVEVTQVDHALTTVRALRSYGAVSPGDPVVKFSLPTESNVASASDSGETMGMVIELQSNMGMTLVAQGNIVYLDRGSEDGVKVGDKMEILRFGGGLPSRSMGEVRVLSTESKTSTALITKSNARVMKGDRFRTGRQSAAAMPVSLSQPASQSFDSNPIPENQPKEIQPQKVAGETRYSLSELMKQVRYDSGEATIKPEGYHLLDQLVAQIKAASPEEMIRVEGHADNMEIGPSLSSIYPTNWDLSKARAVGVVRYLIDKGRIDAARISSIGYGDTKPLMSNDTEAGREKNRRVDIVIYNPEDSQAPVPQMSKSNDAASNGSGFADPSSDTRTASASDMAENAPSDSTGKDDTVPVPIGSNVDAVLPADEQSVPASTDQSLTPSR